MTTPNLDSATPIDVTDLVIAKIAAHAARTTPGVHGLRPSITRQLGRAIPLSNGHNTGFTTDGVHLHTHADRSTADISIDAVLDANVPCLETATAIQRHVHTAVREATGITTIVITINIVDIALEH